MNLITFQVIGVLIGGRVGYLLLYQGDKFLEDPLPSFGYGKVVWPVTVVSSAFLLQLFGMLKNLDNRYKPIGDLIVSVVPPGLFFGRIANFINGELWGKTTEVNWGVTIS